MELVSSWVAWPIARALRAESRTTLGSSPADFAGNCAGSIRPEASVTAFPRSPGAGRSR